MSSEAHCEWMRVEPCFYLQKNKDFSLVLWRLGLHFGHRARRTVRRGRRSRCSSAGVTECDDALPCVYLFRWLASAVASVVLDGRVGAHVDIEAISSASR